MRIHAVVVGVEQPADARLPRTPYAAADARAVAVALAPIAAAPTPLIDAGATAAVILDAVRSALATADRDDLFLLSFAGNVFCSAERTFLVCYETSTEEPERTALPLHELLRAVADAGVRSV